MSKSITLEEPTFQDCYALIEQEGENQTYIVNIDGELATATGSVMRGFLLPFDRPIWFKRF